MGHKMRAYKEWPQGEAERAGLGASASSASGGLDWDSPQAGGSTVVTATQKTTGVTVATVNHDSKIARRTFLRTPQSIECRCMSHS